MLNEIYENIRYFLALNLRPEVFWNVLPLVLCTILIIAYFTRYKSERAGWNTYFSNSLVLIFVSINLFRYIYNINGIGASNYLDYPAKSIAVILLLTIGSLFLKFNFSHLLPEKYARIVNSPLSINSIAYAVMLYVYSSIKTDLNMVLALLVIVLALTLIYESLKFPLKMLFTLFEKEQRADRFRNIKEAKFEIGELERTLIERRKELKDIELKGLEKEKNMVIKLEREIKKRKGY